jgi:hypothetical protein
MRWLPLIGVPLLVGCGAAEVQSQRLKDGSLQVTCELAMDECIRRVQDQCKNQRYRIIEGTSETRLRDAPPFEKAYHTSRLHLRCTDDGAEVLLSLDKPKAEPSPGAAAVCTAGETRACVGTAACKGGQACLPDGKGFGPCDCGPGPSPAPPPAAPEAVPASTPADAVTPPVNSPVEPQNSPAK